MGQINIELGELQAFVAVAEKLNFKAAAETLFISQPALSRRIEKMEGVLNTRLLERTTRRVSLTVAGEQFLIHARSAMEELQMAVQGLTDRAERWKASITVASVPSLVQYLLPRVLAAFAKDHPQTRIKVLDESAQVVLEQVLSGIADFGLNFIGTQEPDIDFKSVYRERYVLAMLKDHPLATRSEIAWGELAGEKLISVSSSSGNRMLIDNALARLGKRPTTFYEANHVAGALGMVEAGLGIAALPNLSLSNLAQGSIVGVPLVKPVITRNIGLITRKGKELHLAASALYDRLKSIGTAVRKR